LENEYVKQGGESTPLADPLEVGCGAPIPADRACVLVTGSAADTPMGNPYVFDHESLAREPRSYMSTRDLKEGSCAALRRKAVRSSANAAIFV